MLHKKKKYTVETKGNKYAIILHADIEDGGYWVECPSLPGCASQGDTIDEALEMIKDAIEGYVKVSGKKKQTLNKKRGITLRTKP